MDLVSTLLTLAGLGAVADVITEKSASTPPPAEPSTPEKYPYGSVGFGTFSNEADYQKSLGGI